MPAHWFLFPREDTNFTSKVCVKGTAVFRAGNILIRGESFINKGVTYLKDI